MHRWLLPDGNHSELLKTIKKSVRKAFQDSLEAANKIA
jgi:hypothetical protein